MSDAVGYISHSVGNTEFPSTMKLVEGNFALVPAYHFSLGD